LVAPLEVKHSLGTVFALASYEKKNLYWNLSKKRLENFEAVAAEVCSWVESGSQLASLRVVGLAALELGDLAALELGDLKSSIGSHWETFAGEAREWVLEGA